MELGTNTTVTFKTLKALLAASSLFALTLFSPPGSLNAGAFGALKEFVGGIES